MRLHGSRFRDSIVNERTINGGIDDTHRMFGSRVVPTTPIKERHMKKYVIAMLAASILAGSVFTGSVSAADWQSLGRINALTAMPNLQQCKQRIINHYWSSKPAYYPNAVNTYGATNIEFVFDLDLRALSTMTSNSPTNSRFKTAIDSYNARTGAKSIHGAVSVGDFPSVSIQVSYADAQGLVQGLGYGVVPAERQFYELQQLCPL
jgi:hypothetical protein